MRRALRAGGRREIRRCGAVFHRAGRATCSDPLQGFVVVRRSRGVLYVLSSHTWLALGTPCPRPWAQLAARGRERLCCMATAVAEFYMSLRAIPGLYRAPPNPQPLGPVRGPGARTALLHGDAVAEFYMSYRAIPGLYRAPPNPQPLGPLQGARGAGRGMD